MSAALRSSGFWPIAPVSGDPIGTCQEYTRILFYVHAVSFHFYNWINEIVSVRIDDNEGGETLSSYRNILLGQKYYLYILETRIH